MIDRLVKRIQIGGGALSSKAGLPPGTLKYVGASRNTEVEIDYYAYGQQELESGIVENVDQVFSYMKPNQVLWLNTNGVHQIDIIGKLADTFQVHPLTQEDLVNTLQRPKFEAFEDYLFVVIKMMFLNDGQSSIWVEQVSIIIGKQFVITFQEQAGDILGDLRKRLLKPGSRLRKNGADYLGYALMDVIVSQYFGVLEWFEQKIEQMELKINEEPAKDFSSEILGLKKDISALRKVVFPLREVVLQIIRFEEKLIQKKHKAFFKDLQDQILYAIETIDSFKDQLSDLQQLNAAGMGKHMNEVMKTLTIIATIFIPLTFIAGIYGMNFENMPELHYPYAYGIVWGVMIFCILIMIWYFRRKDWI